jgi:hypothetical protein
MRAGAHVDVIPRATNTEQRLAFNSNPDPDRLAKSYEMVKKRVETFVSASAYRYVDLGSFFALTSSSSVRH